MRSDAVLLDGIVALAQREVRAQVLEALATRLGVSRVILLVADPLLGQLVPALGTPQTISGGPSWRELVARCSVAVRTHHHPAVRAMVELPPGRSQPSTTLLAHHVALVLVGGQPSAAALRGVERWLPLLAALLQSEVRCVDLAVQVEEARDAAGSAMGVAASVETARVNAAAQRRAAEAESRASSAFLSTMSHEIRTPMNAIIGMMSLALDDGAAGLAPRERGYIERAHSSAVQLLRLLNDVLDVSKIEAGRMTIEQAGLRLDDVLAQVERVARPRAQQKGLALRLQIDRAVPLALVGDALRLAQVLTNLVDNALKFTERGGVSVEVEALAENGAGVDRIDVPLRFRVRDSGIGIDAATVALLFQPFVQADSSTSRRYGGSGLGLSIARRLTELMGGRLWVDSRPGQGSTFSVELTLRRDRARRHAAAPALAGVTGAAGLRGFAVLLVEDDETNIVLACALLERAGMQVDVARDGLEAIAVLDRSPGRYGAVLMDCQMPRLDGYAATERLRTDARHAHLPIIAMSADVMPQDRERARRAGMDDHIAKPIVVATLYSTLARWAAGAGKERTP